MVGNHHLTHPLTGVVALLRDWPVRSQQQARRNAMVAATDCAHRRAQREDVADFFAARHAPRDQKPVAAAHG